MEQSGLFRAGEILLLVGAILAAAGAAFFLVLGVAMGFLQLGDAFGRAEPPFVWFVAAYFGIAVLTGVGAIVGFLAYGQARRGDARGAWIRGLVASLLPPVQVVLLVGAILCLTSPEGQAQQRAASPPTSS